MENLAYMKNLAGTKTQANLMAAFAGESQARSKYFYFAKRAKEEGYDEVASYFGDTAINEQAHAKIWLKFLDGIGTTEENLRSAIGAEHFENTQMYPSYAETAREEGFDAIARLFDFVSSIEKSHEDHFGRLLKKLTPYSAEPAATTVPGMWKCVDCGNIVIVKDAPIVCPVCGNSDGPEGKAFRQLSQ
ncbi:MAG: rubrerythrin family protein [Treponema sp.]|nr:rubrerythrin family protein [Treponema sp.]